MGAIIWWIIVGALAGILAKAIVPGERAEPKGCLMTILLGVAGSLIAGFLIRDVLGMRTGGGFIGSIFGAMLGAIVLIWIFRKFQRSPAR